MNNDTSVQEDQSKLKERRARGEFVRGVSGFRHQIGDDAFPAESGRYHLFVALNCPWCHRVTLARNILGLQESISLNIAFPNRTDEEDSVGPNLWEFSPERVATLTGAPLIECTLDSGTGQGFRLAKQIYQTAGSQEQSVPILYDKKTHRIVNNESADIIRILDATAADLGSVIATNQRVQLYPDSSQLRQQIDDINALVYKSINNGAYKAGFSSDQRVYQAAFDAYFDALTQLNNLLSDGRTFLTGTSFNEADLRLFPTLYRHDPIYYVRMKLNGARIVDYPHLWRWLCRVYALRGVAEAGSLLHCRQGYFGRTGNGVVPAGPLRPMTYPEAYQHPELAAST